MASLDELELLSIAAPYNVGSCGAHFLPAIFTMPFRRSLNLTYTTWHGN
jgi:hypothetical protein